MCTPGTNILLQKVGITNSNLLTRRHTRPQLPFLTIAQQQPCRHRPARMNFMFVVCLSLAVACHIVAAKSGTKDSEEFERDEGVLVLGDTTFDKALKQFEYVLVEFYAPWCGHCKQLAPEYAKAAQQLQEEKSVVQLAKVDATENKDLASKHEIRGFPTLKFYINGKESEYNGPRKADGIVAWVKKRAGFPAVRLQTANEVEKFIEERKVAVLGFFSAEDSSAAKAYLDAARGEDDVEFGIVTNADAAAKYEAKGKDMLILYKQFDEGKVVYDGKWDAKAIKSFVDSNAMPLVIEFSMDVAQKVFGGDVKTHFFLFASDSDSSLSKYKEVLKQLAQDNRGKINIIYLNADDKNNARVTEFFGVVDSELPTVRLVHMDQKVLKYKPESNDITYESLKAFIESYHNNKLKPHLKTEEVAADWDKKSVKVLVGKNFEQVALDKTKDVLVEFYAPWCGHCKKLEPIWDELGDKFKSNDKIVIAKLDATANELESVDIRGFPTIKLFKAGNNEVIDYNGDRTLDAIAAWVESGGKAVSSTGGQDEDDGEDEDDEHDHDHDHDHDDAGHDHHHHHSEEEGKKKYHKKTDEQKEEL